MLTMTSNKLFYIHQHPFLSAWNHKRITKSHVFQNNPFSLIILATNSLFGFGCSLDIAILKAIMRLSFVRLGHVGLR